MILRSFCITILLVPFLALRAQNSEKVLEARKDMFLANNIYVVYTGKPEMDSALKNCFIKYWTIKPIKGFITQEDFKELIKDKNSSFFYTTDYHYEANRTSMNNGRFTSCIIAFNGGRKNTAKYNFLYESTSMVNFDAFRGERDKENAIYRLPLMVAKLQWDINFKYDKGTSTNFDKKKILLVNENLMEEKKWPSIENAALTVWPGKYELMSPDRIAKLISERDSRYYLLVPVLSDAEASISVYDLASMRQLGFYERFGIFRRTWVRSKEIQSLVDKIYNNHTNK